LSNSVLDAVTVRRVSSKRRAPFFGWVTTRISGVAAVQSWRIQLTLPISVSLPLKRLRGASSGLKRKVADSSLRASARSGNSNKIDDANSVAPAMDGDIGPPGSLQNYRLRPASCATARAEGFRHYFRVGGGRCAALLAAEASQAVDIKHR